MWFWVILSDDTPPEDLTFRALKPIEDALEVALNGGATPFVFDVIPYVSYRLLSEQQALQGQS